MRALVAILILLAAVAFAPAGGGSLAAPSDAQAGKRSLTYDAAKRAAAKLATRRARQDPSIVSWELVRGFKLHSGKWVFAWYAQKADGTGCTAQLVTRYASQSSRRIVTYFRIEACS